jgi:hypothetical protein
MLVANISFFMLIYLVAIVTDMRCKIKDRICIYSPGIAIFLTAFRMQISYIRITWYRIREFQQIMNFANNPSLADLPNKQG